MWTSLGLMYRPGTTISLVPMARSFSPRSGTKSLNPTGPSLCICGQWIEDHSHPPIFKDGPAVCLPGLELPGCLCTAAVLVCKACLWVWDSARQVDRACQFHHTAMATGNMARLRHLRIYARGLHRKASTLFKSRRRRRSHQSQLVVACCNSWQGNQLNRRSRKSNDLSL